MKHSITFAGMKSLLRISFLFLFFIYACNNNKTEQKEPTSENDIDAARNFIRAALDGQYSKAKTFMLRDSLNDQWLDGIQNNYETRMTREDKRGYREASIDMHEVRQLGDTASIVSYSNSYMKKNDSLKIVKVGGQWLVDFKYSFQPRKK